MVRSLAVVSNKLEAAKDLANGEETKQLRKQNATTDDLRPRDVPDLVGIRGSAGGRGLEQGAGVLDGAQGAVEVALESGNRPVHVARARG